MKRISRLALVSVLTATTFVTLPWSTVQAAGALTLDDYPPGYPTGEPYGTFTLTLEGLGLLLDGSTNRCDTNAEAGAEIAAATFGAIELLEYVCEALPPVGEDGCYAALGISAVAQFANDTVIAQCAFQDGTIDGAEIEAAYENSVIIHNNLIKHDWNLSDHDDIVQGELNIIQGKLDVLLAGQEVLLGGQEETIRLLHTPNGRRTSDYYVNACDDGDGCVWND